MLVYLKAVLRYFGLWVLTIQIVICLWTVYRIEEIFVPGSGEPLRSYVAPSWHKLANRVRKGEIVLTKDEQAKRFDKIGRFFSSEAAFSELRVAMQVEKARFTFRLAMAVCVLQFVFILLLARQDVRGTKPGAASESFHARI